jgi:hypothetical protein
MLCAAGAVTLVACDEHSAPGKDGFERPVAIDGNAVKAHVELLADDLHEGREAGKRGYQLAAKYVAAQYQTIGLQPGNSDSYFQTVAFKAASVVPGSRAFAITSAAKEQSFKTFDEYTISANVGDDSVTTTAPLVRVARSRQGCWRSRNSRSCLEAFDRRHPPSARYGKQARCAGSH